VANIIGTSFATSGFSFDGNISPFNQTFSSAVRAVLTRPQLTLTGNVTINAGVGVDTLDVFGAANFYAETITGSPTSGQSYGLQVSAGFTSGDGALAINNYAQNTAFMRIYGDGHGLLGPNATNCLSWDTNGAFTINQPASGFPLKISNDHASGAGITFHDTNASPNDWDIGLGVGTGAKQLNIYDRTALAVRMSLDTAGSFTFNAPSSGSTLIVGGSLNQVVATFGDTTGATNQIALKAGPINLSIGELISSGFAELISSQANPFYVGTQGAYALNLCTNSTSRIQIDSTGQVSVLAPSGASENTLSAAYTSAGGASGSIFHATTTTANAPGFYYDVATGNALVMNSSGADWGVVGGTASQQWSLGFTSALTTLLTPVVTWGNTAAAIYFPGNTSAAGGTAAVLDQTTSPAGQLRRTTSSRRYKTQIEDLNNLDSTLLKLRPVWYRSTCEQDRKDWSWYGLIAEEVGELDPRFLSWARDDAGELIPESVDYARISVLLVAYIQRLEQRLAAAGIK
jgi:hypothetical protein